MERPAQGAGEAGRAARAEALTMCDLHDCADAMRDEPKTPGKHLFEGERLTVAQIMKRVPALSRGTILKYLKDGMHTRAAMLNYDPRAAMREGGKEGARRAGRMKFGRGK
jgi:hypothetical protein